MKILAVGDVVGNGGTNYVRRYLWTIRRKCRADVVVLNGENAARGNGLDKDTAEALLAAGADVITSGNHIWKKHETRHFLDDMPLVLRPANYPLRAPGNGCTVIEVNGVRLLVLSLLGNTFMPDNLASPFETADMILERMTGEYDICVTDIHAEATSEKAALARYLDGRVSVVFGTHTHVQTNDARVLPNGTGFVTDIGMVGYEESVLGVRSDCVLERFLTQMPTRFEEPTEGDIRFCGALFEVDERTGLTAEVSLVNLLSAPQKQWERSQCE